MDSGFFELLHKSYEEIQRDSPLQFTSPFESRQCVQLCLLNGNVLGSDVIWVDKRIEERSKVILDTFNDVLRKTFVPVMETDIQRIDYAKSFVVRDFSVLVSCLSRVLEIELNLSIVQWIRGYEGIEMPQYYDRVKPGCTLTVLSDINLNEEKYGKLKAQALWNIQNLMNKYKDCFPRPIRDFILELLPICYKLRKTRNDASHSIVNSEDEFVNFYHCYCLIIKRGWFSELMNLKEQLKGGSINK